MAVTIEDIAREAGVSIATVSRVMNNTKAVSGDLKDRVNAVIEKNHFKPNALARSLITKKTQVMGIIIPDISNTVYGLMVKGINEICYQEGYTLMVCESKGEKKRELELLKTLEDKQIDGILLAGHHNDNAIMDTLKYLDYPAILVGQEASNELEDFNVVTHDNRKASFMATKLLLDYGHRNIAYIGEPIQDYTLGLKRMEGYQEAITGMGIQIKEAMIEYGDSTYDAGWECMRRIHQQNKELPTAVLAGNDVMAIGAISYLNSVGLKVPADVSVMGMEGLEINAHFTPKLSTVLFPYYEEGIKAAKILINTINGTISKEEKKTYYLDHKIIQRDSVIKCQNMNYSKRMEVYLL